MTDDWKIIYDALYHDGKKTDAQIQTAPTSRLTNEEKTLILGV